MDNTKIVYASIFFLFFIFSIIQSFYDSPSAVIRKEIPITKIGHPTSKTPKLLFLYCYSCGYQNAFKSYASALSSKYPDMVIEGENYDPSFTRVFVARALGVLKFVLICYIVVSQRGQRNALLGQLKWLDWCVDNKVYACASIFFVSNYLEKMLMTTGAFEVFMNGDLVWSKLENGYIPHVSELLPILEQHRSMYSYDTVFST